MLYLGARLNILVSEEYRSRNSKVANSTPGLGFSVFVTILLLERFGSPIMKSASVIGGLLVGCIIAGATGYFDPSGIDAAPAASFIWVHTFPLTVYGPLVLPTMVLYIICACEAIGDITATCDGMTSQKK